MIRSDVHLMSILIYSPVSTPKSTHPNYPPTHPQKSKSCLRPVHYVLARGNNHTSILKSLSPMYSTDVMINTLKATLFRSRFNPMLIPAAVLRYHAEYGGQALPASTHSSLPICTNRLNALEKANFSSSPVYN